MVDKSDWSDLTIEFFPGITQNEEPDEARFSMIVGTMRSHMRER
jgi:hypothetical protein